MTSRTPPSERVDGTHAARANGPCRRRGAGCHPDVLFALVVLFSAATGTTTRGDERAAFFENRIRPLFERVCVECHSGDDASGGVRLTDRAGWADAGVVEPGRPEASRLLAVLTSVDPDERMPPADSVAALSAAEIRDVATWITAGAFDPRETPAAAANAGPRLRSRVFAITPEDESWWAFQPITPPAFTPAESALAPSARIDLLVRRRLAAASETAASMREDPGSPGGLPSPPATPRELVRRASFDLWGLPPAPETVAAFAADPSEAAWQRLVDGLLASHHYGERWAQHWLDWVRYAETNGYERDGPKPNAWRYRDYCIRAINDDKPFDRFLIEQLAGDEWAAARGLSPDNEPAAWRDAIVATGFLRLHQWDDEPDSSDQAELDDADDVLVTISSAFLGLTVGCARCHDHKYDPVSQADYYSLLAFLRGVDPYGAPKRGGGGRGTGRIQQVLGATPGATPLPERALAVAELPEPRPTFVLHRGDRGSPRGAVEPTPPGILRGLATVPTIVPLEGSSGRRLALATWLADPRNPLPARVLANRVWQRHFGTGLVPTPDDFGRTGVPPTNLPLLDFLAGELIRSGWSMRHLQRIILTSHAYRMTSRMTSAAAQEQDPDVRLVWRQTIRRLDAEAIRDSLLAIGGHLGDKRSGPSVAPVLAEQARGTEGATPFRWPDTAPEDCRSVFLVVTRNHPVPFLETLDRLTVSSPTVVRPLTTTAPQALMLLNDPWVQWQAERVATRIAREAGSDPGARVVRLWQLACQREPTVDEMAAAREHLLGMTADGGSDAVGGSSAVAWTSLCRAVLTSNEAIHVE